MKTTILDIDECSNGRAECNLKIEYCENIPGSFTCACKAGYEKVSL